MTIQQPLYYPFHEPIVTLWEIDIPAMVSDSGEIETIRITPHVTEERATIAFLGNQYNPFPIEAEGFEQTSGALARPTLTMSHITELIAGDIEQYRGLQGFYVRRIQVTRSMLDDRREAGFDVTYITMPETYIVNRASSINKIQIKLELMTPIDLQSLKKVPRRCLTGHCTRVYRRWNAKKGEWSISPNACPYASDAMYNEMNQAVLQPELDRCAKTVQACKVRFGMDLPHHGFPSFVSD